MNTHGVSLSAAVAPETSAPFFDYALARSLLPIVVPIGLASGLLFRGFDSAQGAAACSIINGMMVMAMLLLRPPILSFWTGVAPILTLAGGAALWLILIQVGIPVVPFADRPVAFAPDMFAPEFAGWMAGLYAFMIGALMAANRRDARWAMNTVLFAMCGILLIGLIVRSVGGQGALDYWSLSRQGRFAGTIGNANVTAVVAGMVALLATGRLLSLMRREPGKKPDTRTTVNMLCHAGAWLIAVVALASTASRVPIILTTALVLLLTARTLSRGRINWTRLAVYAAPAIILVTVIAQAELFQTRLDGTSYEWGARLGLWSQYWDIAMTSPVYGYGLGGFQSINVFAMSGVRFAEGAWIVNSAHSLVLQILLVGGAPYLLLMTALGWRVARDIVRDYAGSPWSTRRWSVALAILLIVLCAMVDIVMDVPSTITLALFLTGLLWGRGVFVEH